jgi:hypothetical protein
LNVIYFNVLKTRGSHVLHPASLTWFKHTTIYRGEKISDTRNRLNPNDTYIIIALSFLFFCVDQKSKVTDFIGNYSTMERRRFFLF